MSFSALKNRHFFTGVVTLPLFVTLAIVMFFPQPALEENLVEISATIIRVENEKGHKGNPDLVITVKDSEVRFRSSSPYPSKFKYGRETPTAIAEGVRATFVLNQSDVDEPPRRHRIKNYDWRRFVGLTIEDSIHLHPKDHESWHTANGRLGRFFAPVLCLVSLYLIIAGYREDKKMNAIEIRPLRSADCDKIGPLLREVWLDAYHGIQTDEELLTQADKVFTPELIALEIDDPNIYSVVAVREGRIIGHARSDLSGGRVDLFRLYLLREFYGQGMGKALLREVETYFDPKYDVWTEVYEENQRAVDFYLSQGYEIMERATEVQTEGRDVFEFKMRKQRRG